MSEQLKACPFCGGADIRIHKHPGEGTGLHHQGDDVYSMGCYGCGAMFPSCYRPALFAEKWNTRAQDFDTLAQRLQEAERLLREIYSTPMKHCVAYAVDIEDFLAVKGDKP